MELVASNEALRRRNTRLNPYLLFEGSHKWVSVHGGGSFSRDLRTWWALVDSNHGPRPYQGRALTT